MSVDSKRLQSVFVAAMDAPDRAALLDRECAGDPELRQRVEKLLAAHDDEADLPVVADRTSAYQPIAETVGTKIGPYMLREQIGEGGFGLVFVAEQQEPVKRKVALKVIKPGMDSRQVIARFEAERQALAMMDHPNIAKVFDASATDSGRPYFVMELVRGIPITEYCDKNQLPPRDRLELFITVCQAIQHAHQKGIIHRDIKPSNVLVTSHDGKPVAKVIDFGVAKAMHQQLTDHSIYTNFAQMIGTPLYMSPEQAEMSGLDIDTRSDIYSLGVLLYELLTGTTPLEKKRFAKAAYDEIRRLICQEEPPKPSTRLSSSDSIASVAAQRKTEPAKLSKLVRGDLDWITMKALEKDRTRRYETANGLARDIQRYLCDEPVEASPPSTTYRMRKFAKKNRAALSTAGAIAFLLVAGIGVSLWQAIRASRAAEGERVARIDAQAQKESALASAERESEERKNADAAKLEAQAREAEANAVVEFFETQLFAAARPKGQEGGLGASVTLRDAIASSVSALDTSFTTQPLVEARLRNTLGITFWHLAEYEHARSQFARARELCARYLDLEHPFALNCTHNLVNSYVDLNRHAEALKLCEEVFEIRKRVLPRDHPDTLLSMNNLAIICAELNRPNEALKLSEEVLEIQKRVLPKDAPATLRSMHNLGSRYLDANRPIEALKLFEESLAIQKRVLPPEHPDTLANQSSIALCYEALHRPAEALKLFEEALTLQKRVLPQDHPATLKTMHNLANSYEAMNRPAEALAMREEVLAIRKRVLPKDHHFTLTSMSSLALSYETMNRHPEALKLREEVFAIRKRDLPKDHPEMLRAMARLAHSYAALNRQAEALALREEVLATQKRVLPKDHIETLASMGNLAASYLALNRPADALKLYEELLPIQKRVLPADHPHLLLTMDYLTKCYSALNRHEDALKLGGETLALYKTKYGPNHIGTLGFQTNLAIRYRDAKRERDALPLLEDSFERKLKSLPANQYHTFVAAIHLAPCYEALNRGADAIATVDRYLNHLGQGAGIKPEWIDELLAVRILATSKAGDPAGCRTTAEMGEKRNPTDAGRLYSAACRRAVTAAVQAKAPGADAVKLAQADADRAMEWLQKAVKAGFKDVAQLKKASELVAVRDREDFKTLIAELESRVQPQKPKG